MASPLHPRAALFGSERTVPLVPACDHYAGTERRMLKALALLAERGEVLDVTLDLEDGAPAGREADHRDLVVELLRRDENAAGRAGVRVHEPESAHFAADVATVLAGAADRIGYLTLPKVASARQLSEVLAWLRQVAARAGRRRELPVHVLVETPGAVEDVFAIAAQPGLRGLDFGLMDYVSSHLGAIDASAMRSPGQFEHAVVRRAKTRQVAAALAHGLVPVHGVTLAARDTAQVAADARRARAEFGYLRMWSIHPDQIDPILDAFAPDAAAVPLAAQVLLAARAADWGPVSIEGVLYDRASYRHHWRLLEQARASGTPLPAEIVEAFFAEPPG